MKGMLANAPQAAAEDAEFTNHRGQKLAARLFLPPGQQEIRAVLARHHGLGDYKHRPAAGLNLFASKGIAVWTFDMHGHGESEPTEPDGRVAIESFADVVDDAEQFLTDVVLPWCARLPTRVPLLLGGASMGALAAMHVAPRVPELDGLIVSAAAVYVKRDWVMSVQEMLVPFLLATIPKMAIVPVLQPEKICQDPELIATVEKDDMLWKGNIRVCTACSILDGMNQLPAVLPSIKVPVLMLHGSADLVCDATSARDALETMASKDKTWICLQDAYHDLEFDYYKEDWHKHVLEWIETRISQFQTGKV